MKRGTKKIKNWIKSFPEDIQERIYYNINIYSAVPVNKVLDYVVGSQSDALLSCFTWSSTEEIGQGFNYWNNIHEDLLSKGK